MTELYKQHAKTVYKYLITITQDVDIAEELTQETFYQAIKSIDSYKGDCKVSTWLCQIAKHLWYKTLKKRKFNVPLHEIEISDTSLIEDNLLSRDNHIMLLQHIHKLNDPIREVMYLRLNGELNFREIGDIVGKSENWARVNFYRGKEKIILEVQKNEK